MIPLMPSPGKPKMVFDSPGHKPSTKWSATAAVFDMNELLNQRTYSVRHPVLYLSPMSRTKKQIRSRTRAFQSTVSFVTNDLLSGVLRGILILVDRLDERVRLCHRSDKRLSVSAEFLRLQMSEELACSVCSPAFCLASVSIQSFPTA
jgi:hypothetical protein